MGLRKTSVKRFGSGNRPGAVMDSSYQRSIRLFSSGLPVSDLFPHVVEWHGGLYLEDGLHRALRAALQQRNQIHARVLVIDN